MSSTRVDGHAGLADVADDPGVVAVVAAVGGQVEGHRQAHLAGGQVAAVEGVRLLGGGEAGVLADRPRPVGVHRSRARRARTGRSRAGCRAGRRAPRQVVGGVERLDVDALGGGPHEAVGVGALQLLGGQGLPVVDRRFCLLGHVGRSLTPRSLRGGRLRPEKRCGSSCSTPVVGDGRGAAARSRSRPTTPEAGRWGAVHADLRRIGPAPARASRTASTTRSVRSGVRPA